MAFISNMFVGSGNKNEISNMSIKKQKLRIRCIALKKSIDVTHRQIILN